MLELVLPPLLTAALAVLVALVHSWREGKDRRRRAREDLAWATAQLDFIERWLAVRDRLSTMEDVSAALQGDMATAFTRARPGMAPTPMNEKRRLSIVTALRRVFLLRRMPRGAGLLHTFYFLSLMGALIWNAAGASILSEQGLDGGPVGTSPVASIFGYVMTMLLGVLPAVAFWIATVHAERRLRAQANEAFTAPSGADADRAHPPPPQRR